MSTDPYDEDNLDRIVRSANRISEAGMPRPSESEAAQDLYKRITGTPYAGRVFKSRRRRTPALFAAIVATVGIAVGVAVATTTSHTVVHTLSVSCYSADSLQGEQVVVDAQAGGPVVACAHAWSQGRVGTGPVPLLAACVTPQGVAAVFPSAAGADVCGQLGLPALPAGQSTLPVSTSTTTTSTSLPGTMPVSPGQAIVANLRAACLSASQASAMAKLLFAKAHLAWTVVVTKSFPAGRPCASPAFDEPLHQLVLTGIPPLSGMTTEPWFLRSKNDRAFPGLQRCPRV